jgi:hypothetical protein
LFTPQPQPLHQLSHPTPADAHSGRCELLPQFRQGQGGLLPQPAPHPLLDLLRGPALGAMTQLHRPLLLPGAQLLGPNLLAVPPAHPELGRQFPQAQNS